MGRLKTLWKPFRVIAIGTRKAQPACKSRIGRSANASMRRGRKGESKFGLRCLSLFFGMVTWGRTKTLEGIIPDGSGMSMSFWPALRRHLGSRLVLERRAETARLLASGCRVGCPASSGMPAARSLSGLAGLGFGAFDLGPRKSRPLCLLTPRGPLRPLNGGILRRERRIFGGRSLLHGGKKA